MQHNHRKDGTPENLSNENCSTICDILPISSMDINSQQQLSSTSVLTTASSSNLDEMSAATFEAQRYWVAQSAFPHHNYNPLLFAQQDWISK
jgi:hypothetical protein